MLACQDCLPFDVLFMVLRMLTVKQRVCVGSASRWLSDAVASTWSSEKELPDLTPAPDSTQAALLVKFSNLRVLDLQRVSPGALRILEAAALARRCRRIASFKSVRLEDLSFVAEYVLALRLPASRVPVQSLEMLLDDWQTDMPPPMYPLMRTILAACGSLSAIRVENSSYGLLQQHDVWRLIGSRITCLTIACPYVSVIRTFGPGPALTSLSSSLTQTDFNYLCSHCPLLQVLEETTFFREQLPDHSAVLALQSDPSCDSDLILDLKPLLKLTRIKRLTLTSLISPASLLHLAAFLAASGGLLHSLDLNLSSGSLDVLQAVFQSCVSLHRLTVFLTCSSAADVPQLTARVKSYAAAAASAANLVLVFRHERKTVCLNAIP